MIELIMTCPFCRKNHKVVIVAFDYDRYCRDIAIQDAFPYLSPTEFRGVAIQDAFPYLSPTEREEIISGICPKCQEEIFSE